MRNAAVLCAGALAMACATTSTTGAPQAGRAPSVYDGAPAWVTRGGGAFGGERGKSFFGVGTASNIQKESLRRTTADSNARADIARAMDTYVANLLKQYQESTSAVTKEGTSPQEVQMVTNTLKTFTQKELEGVQIVDRWISNDNGTEFALAQLDFDAFQDELSKVHELSDRMREVIKQRSDAAFEDMAKEEAKHPIQQ